MNLKSKLQQIARNKILKSQVSSVVKSQKTRAAKSKKPHVGNIKKARVAKKRFDNEPERASIFFPPMHIDIVYNRPPEARLQTEKVRELTNKFLENTKNKKESKSKSKFGAVTESLLRLKKQKQN